MHRRAPLELRSAVTAGATTYNRAIEIVAAPAEQPADVIIDGRMVEERYAGARSPAASWVPSRPGQPG